MPFVSCVDSLEHQGRVYHEEGIALALVSLAQLLLMHFVYSRSTYCGNLGKCKEREREKERKKTGGLRSIGFDRPRSDMNQNRLFGEKGGQRMKRESGRKRLQKMRPHGSDQASGWQGGRNKITQMKIKSLYTCIVRSYCVSFPDRGER
jgi:hypothetical protein